ncbi:MAG: tRNA (N6-isopentenyl adenosine(37)-C2)-methylthiotransferase MiaB [Ruminococcus sp.]|nr:tRNA (N6-isopentenyl adenosine(37)-C2)-methylthiotransferase MiaB [Ruminococcus sp.]
MYSRMGGKAYVHSFGCQLNVSDGEKMKGILASLGFTFTESYENADLILLNTCAVRESAEDTVYGTLGNIKKYKKQNPGVILILAGCMASEPKTLDKVRSHYPFVDILFGTSALSQLPKLLLEHYEGKKLAYDMTEYSEEFGADDQIRESTFKASVPIMFGCNNFCTYCIVPYVRGRERSRSAEVIIREVEDLVAKGYKEIMLLGQNVNSYGNDLEGGMSFAQLLRRLNEIPGEFWIRFMSSHPKDATPELLDAILECDKVGKHLHLPVQCGSDTVLKRMNRHYTAEKYLEIVDYLRARSEGFSLSSDIMVGFPDETEAEFEDTLKLVERVKYDNIYTFIYSKRSGTAAAEMEDATPDAQKRVRMERLLTLQRQVATENYRRFIGQTVRVLVEGESKQGEGWLFGKSSAYTIVEFQGDQSLIGTFADVKITDARNWAVSGVLVK